MSKPVVHLFHLGIDKKNRDAFYQVGVENFRTSYEEEAGTLAMYASSLKKNSLEYKVFEVYADEAGYQTHLNSPHFQAYVEQVGSQLTKREVYDVEALFLEGKLPSGMWLGAGHHFLKFAQIQVRVGCQETFERSAEYAVLYERRSGRFSHVCRQGQSTIKSLLFLRSLCER